jgi:hypothetical protein
MPLLIPTSAVLGPRPTGGPATLPAYLVSIAKDSFYGIYTPGQNMAPNSDGSGGAVADGGAVGSWSTSEALNWNWKFIQASAAARPAYGATISPLGPAIYGNGTSQWMKLNSDTALNGGYTVLMSFETTNTAGAVFSQNGVNFAWRELLNLYPAVYVTGDARLGVALPRAVQEIGIAETVIAANAATDWKSYRSVAVSSPSPGTVAGNALNGFPFVLLSSNGVNLFSSARIAKIAFTPRLTRAECVQAITYPL